MGLLAFIFTVLLSIQNNFILTSLLNGLYSFILLFIGTFLIRFIIGAFLQPKIEDQVHAEVLQQGEQQAESTHVGQHFDMQTPDDSADQQQSEAQPFTPLNPPKLSTKEAIEPERVAETVRHWTAD